MDGVISQIDRMTYKPAVKMTQIVGWKDKIIQWIREQKVDGKKMMGTTRKELNTTLRLKLEPNEPASKKLNGPCSKMLNICKKMPVHKVLEAAKSYPPCSMSEDTERVLEECTVEQIVTLFAYRAVNVEAQEDDDVSQLVVDGVFAQIERQTSMATVQMTQIDGWKEKIVQWIRRKKIDGKKIKTTTNKELNMTLRIQLVPDERASKRLNGPCTKMFNICRNMPVHLVLRAARLPPPPLPLSGNTVLNPLNSSLSQVNGHFLDNDLFRNMIREDHCGQIAECHAVRRIVQCLDYYSILMTKLAAALVPEKMIYDIFADVCDQHYGRDNMISDYTHFMQCHSDVDSAQHIAGQLQFPCDGVTGCGHSARHFENKSINIYVDTLDTVHCYLLHLEELGLRKSNSTQSPQSEMTATEQQQSGQTLTNTVMTRLTRNIVARRRFRRHLGSETSSDFDVSKNGGKDTDKDKMIQSVFKKLSAAERSICRNVHDFMEEHSADTDCLEEDLILFHKHGESNLSRAVEHHKEIIGSMTAFFRKRRFLSIRKTFQAGFTLFYWKWYRTATNEAVMQNYLLSNMDMGGQCVQNLFVEARFGSIKEEALNSGHVLVGEWNNVVTLKARYRLQTSHCRKLQSKPFGGDGGDDPLHFGIANGSLLSTEHLEALILYTDFTEYSTAFSESTRKVDWDEDLDSVKQRNSQYCHTSRLLREAVTYFGSDGRGKMNGRENGPFWLGLNVVLTLNEFSIGFNVPTSTSKTMEIAITFAGKGGMVMQVNNWRGDSASQPFLDTRWFSAHPEEDERLWSGNIFKLSVEKVDRIQPNGSFDASMMYLFDAALSGSKIKGTFLSLNQYDMLQHCLRMMREGADEAKMSHSLGDFTAKNVLSFFQKKSKLLLWPRQLKGVNEQFQKLIFHGIKETAVIPKDATNIMTSDLLNAFPNLEEVELRADGFPLNLEVLLSILGQFQFPESFQELKIRDWRQDWLRDAFDSNKILKHTFILCGWFIERKTEYFVDWLSIRPIHGQSGQRNDVEKHENELGDEMPSFKRIAKPYPGTHFKDQYPNKEDPRGEPTFIEFKWNKEFTEIYQCDTIHMLYLLQCACELHRQRVNKRNRYFMSISRPDRYLFHVDTPQIITNLIEWHNMDNEKNVFTGEMLQTQNELLIINGLISDIGGIKKGPATRIFANLTKNVIIEYDKWTSANSKLRLETWGLTKMYEEETVLEECTVEQIVTLFEYRAINVDEIKVDVESEKSPEWRRLFSRAIAPVSYSVQSTCISCHHDTISPFTK